MKSNFFKIAFFAAVLYALWEAFMKDTPTINTLAPNRQANLMAGNLPTVVPYSPPAQTPVVVNVAPAVAASSPTVSTTLIEAKLQALLDEMQLERHFISDEIIKLDDTNDARLTLPAGANLAELQVIGCDAMSRIGASPAVGECMLDNEGSPIELEDADTINKILYRAVAGSRGYLIVNYFKSNHINA